MLGELRRAFGQQDREAVGAIDERHEHRGGDGVHRQTALQFAGALRIETEEAPVRELVLRSGPGKPAHDAVLEIRVARAAQPPPPPPPCNPPRVSAAGSRSRRSSASSRPDISRATSSTGRPSAYARFAMAPA